jgi:hypothetical protein
MPPPGPVIASDPVEDASNNTILFDKQVSTIIEMAPDIWKHTSGIKDMPNSLRVYVLIHRIISRFQVEFNHEPNLDHFIDAFANHDVPKPLKNAPGLSCKACQVESSHQLTGAYYAKPTDRKTFNVLTLLSHFKTQHLPAQQYGFSQGHQGPTLDWKENMIELPSDRFISGLIHAPGMDDDKLLMIARVFPSLFPMPLPKIGVIDHNGVASPSLASSRDGKTVPGPNGTTVEALEKSISSALVTPKVDSPKPPQQPQEDFDLPRPAPHADSDDTIAVANGQHASRDSPSGERRQRYYAEPRYYVSVNTAFNCHQFIGANQNCTTGVKRPDG